MNRVANVRTKIYDHFQGSNSCQQHFFAPANEDAYVAYYNSMYLLQDTTESLGMHRTNDFSPHPLTAYLEFWGLMQAVNIQQDAICELHKVVCGADLNAGGLRAWGEVRELRHLCAGHPAKKALGGPLTRTFMGRGFGNYNSFQYERWEKKAGTSHPKVALGKLLDEYASEAECSLQAVLTAMCTKWP